jgi:hypothetical protein
MLISRHSLLAIATLSQQVDRPYSSAVPYCCSTVPKAFATGAANRHMSCPGVSQHDTQATHAMAVHETARHPCFFKCTRSK